MTSHNNINLKNKKLSMINFLDIILNSIYNDKINENKHNITNELTHKKNDLFSKNTSYNISNISLLESENKNVSIALANSINPIIKYINTIKLIKKNYFYDTYSCKEKTTDIFNLSKINELLYNKKTRLKTYLIEDSIYNDCKEYLKSYYKKSQINNILAFYTEFYKNFCIYFPIFSNHCKLDNNKHTIVKHDDYKDELHESNSIDKNYILNNVIDNEYYISKKNNRNKGVSNIYINYGFYNRIEHIMHNRIRCYQNIINRINNEQIKINKNLKNLKANKKKLLLENKEDNNIINSTFKKTDNIKQNNINEKSVLYSKNIYKNILKTKGNIKKNNSCNFNRINYNFNENVYTINNYNELNEKRLTRDSINSRISYCSSNVSLSNKILKLNEHKPINNLKDGSYKKNSFKSTFSILRNKNKEISSLSILNTKQLNFKTKILSSSKNNNYKFEKEIENYYDKNMQDYIVPLNESYKNDFLDELLNNSLNNSISSINYRTNIDIKKKHRKDNFNLSSINYSNKFKSIYNNFVSIEKKSLLNNNNNKANTKNMLFSKNISIKEIDIANQIKNSKENKSLIKELYSKNKDVLLKNNQYTLKNFNKNSKTVNLFNNNTSKTIGNDVNNKSIKERSFNEFKLLKRYNLNSHVNCINQDYSLSISLKSKITVYNNIKNAINYNLHNKDLINEFKNCYNIENNNLDIALLALHISIQIQIIDQYYSSNINNKNRLNKYNRCYNNQNSILNKNSTRIISKFKKNNNNNNNNKLYGIKNTDTLYNNLKISENSKCDTNKLHLHFNLNNNIVCNSSFNIPEVPKIALNNIEHRIKKLSNKLTSTVLAPVPSSNLPYIFKYNINKK